MKGRNQKITVNEYKGNHPAVKDSSSHNPHGIDVRVATFLNDCKFYGYRKDIPLLTDEVLEQVKITSHKSCSFASCYTVSAPGNVWDLAAQALDDYLANM